MSLDASVWAWKQAVGKSAAKLVLLSLADRACADHTAYPSIASLTADTELDRKTIIGALNHLKELGLIEDTGERRGSSGRVVVYRLVGVVDRAEPAKEQSQKRNHPKKGTVPKTEGNSPKNGTTNRPKNGTTNSPKNGTRNLSVEPINEPIRNHKPIAPRVSTQGEGGGTSPDPTSAVVPAPQPRCVIPEDMPGPKDQNTPTFKTWANYAVAYRKRYGVWPVWNAKTGGQVGMLVKRLGADEAPRVAAWYLSVNDARVVQACHAIGHLLSAAEAYRTQYLTGRQVTGTTARQIENTQANVSAAHEAAARIHAGVVHDNPFLR